ELPRVWGGDRHRLGPPREPRAPAPGDGTARGDLGYQQVRVVHRGTLRNPPDDQPAAHAGAFTL
ncbi:MAG: hypothetical protein AVDCRST_MAG93-5202, partial [uncultured Chloroflexia bacterium]